MYPLPLQTYASSLLLQYIIDQGLLGPPRCDQDLVLSRGKKPGMLLNPCERLFLLFTFYLIILAAKLGNINLSSLNTFLASRSDDKRGNVTYPRAYHFFEALRIHEGEPKSKARGENEIAQGSEGFSTEPKIRSSGLVWTIEPNFELPSISTLSIPHTTSSLTRTNMDHFTFHTLYICMNPSLCIGAVSTS